MNNPEVLKQLVYKRGFVRKFFNSVLHFPLPYILRNVLRARMPINKTAYWQSRQVGEKRGPQEYLRLAPTSQPLLDEIMQRCPDKNVRILDLGCNCGRHLNYLFEQGFSNLFGVDVNKEAEVLGKENFPALFAKTSFSFQSFQDYLPKIENNYFALIFTHGTTIEDVPPRFPLVKHLCRVAKNYIILANVSLSGGEFPRFWLREFQRYGFSVIKLLQPEQEWAKDSLENRPHSLIVLQKNYEIQH